MFCSWFPRFVSIYEAMPRCLWCPPHDEAAVPVRDLAEKEGAADASYTKVNLVSRSISQKRHGAMKNQELALPSPGLPPRRAAAAPPARCACSGPSISERPIAHLPQNRFYMIWEHVRCLNNKAGEKIWGATEQRAATQPATQATNYQNVQSHWGWGRVRARHSSTHATGLQCEGA
jgi:hypothetical protein